MLLIEVLCNGIVKGPAGNFCHSAVPPPCNFRCVAPMLSSARMKRGVLYLAAVLVGVGAVLGARVPQTTERRTSSFEIQEATIDRIQDAIRKKQITTRGVVEEYLRRIKAYNGTCVKEPQGILGSIATIAHAGQINALSTLNLRPAART